MMNIASFAKGIGVGVVAGAAAYMMLAPQINSKVVRKTATRTIQAVGDAIEHAPRVPE